MKKTLITIILVVMIVVALFAFAGCDKDDDQITFLLDWTPNTNHTGLYVALELGYFKQAGFDNVKIEQPGETGTSMLVASGNAQFGVDFQEQMAPNRDAGIEVTAIATIIQHNTSGIISLKNDNILSPKDMEGKEYATWGLPIEQAIVKKVMQDDGGDYDKLILHPDFVTDALTALKTDQIDCAWVYEAWDLERAKLEGLEYNYFSFKDINPVFDFYSPVIIANNKYMANNPDKVKAFIGAVKKGYEYAMAHPAESADILCKYAPELDKALVHSSQKYLATKYAEKGEEWGKIDPVRWNNFYNFLNANNLVETPIPENYGFTNQFLD